MVEKPATRLPRRELVSANRPECIDEVRAFLRACLDRYVAPPDLAYEVMVAAGEAFANSCIHSGKPAGTGSIRVRCTLEEGEIVTVVSDNGSGFDVAASEQAVWWPQAGAGRGLLLMRGLMDEVDIESSDQGATVTLIRRLERKVSKEAV